MKLDDDFNSSYEKGKYQSTAVMLGIIAVIAIVIIVLAMNKSKISSQKSQSSSTVSDNVSASEPENSETSEPVLITGSSLHPSDLDFFEMYPQEEDTSVSEDETETSVEEDPATDGNHTLITLPDGTEEWVSISKYITKNIYDYTNITDIDGIRQYSYNDRVVSSFGVDISKDQDYVDFIKLQKAGVDFVMIRVGARGYSSGQLVMDDYFEDNIRRATAAGLDVGVYFISQAVTEEEAVEEAELVIKSVGEYPLVYPVAYVMEYKEGEVSRVEALSKQDKTTIARAFLKKIDEAGYKSMVYGTKAWLIKYVELNKIASDYDIWLSEISDIPSYPYEFTMWQYNKSGMIDGISKEVNFDLCFVDYSLR